MAKTKYVSVSIPVEIAREIDRIVKSGVGGYTSRTELVKDAIRRRLEELKTRQMAALIRSKMKAAPRRNDFLERSRGDYPVAFQFMWNGLKTMFAHWLISIEGLVLASQRFRWLLRPIPASKTSVIYARTLTEFHEDTKEDPIAEARMEAII